MDAPTNNKSKVLFEILVVALIFMSMRTVAKFFDIKYASQIALVVAVAIITVFLKKKNSSWKDLGFRKPDSWGLSLLYIVLCIASIAIIFNFVIAPFFPEGVNDINRGEAISYYEMLFQVFFIAIGTAAIGEELLFRGYLFNALNDLFGRNVMGTAGAVVLQAVIFAVLHNGIQGMISAGVIGVIMALFYLLAQRNLIVVMVAHAVPDIISVISTYQSQ